MTTTTIKMPNEQPERNLPIKEKKPSISVYEVLNHEVDKKRTGNDLKKFLDAQTLKS